MPYTSCGACGAKALVGATRCPRCQAPFVSYDVHGQRVPTVNCPSCGVQRPAAIGVCPNCLTSTGPSRRLVARGLLFTGMAIAAIIIVGYVISMRVGKPTTLTRPMSSVPAAERGEDSVAASGAGARIDTTGPARGVTLPPAPASTPASSPAPVAVVAASVSAAVVPPKPAPPPTVAVPDTGRWDVAVATTWVRVRSAPSRDSDVLRMIDSAQRVRLGASMNGWRAVRVGVDRGWVDPRLFTAAPTPRP